MFARIAGRTGATLALGALMVTGTGMGALAHECYNASRSAQGNESAGSHSQAWFTLRIADAIAGDVEAGAYSAEDGACILAAYTATGAPLSFTIHAKGANGQGGVIAERNPNSGLMTNGKGIDHFFDAWGWAIFQAFDECGVTPPF